MSQVINGGLIDVTNDELCNGRFVIPEGVTIIGFGAFHGCTSLAEITLPEGVTKIGYGAFVGCENLREIVIPEGVTSIAGGAFHGCSSLREITIPESVMSMGFGVFVGCSKLEKVRIYDSNTYIMPASFDNCDNLQEIIILETDESHKKSDKIIEMLPVELRTKVRIHSMYDFKEPGAKTSSSPSSSPSSFFSQGPSEDENGKGKEEIVSASSAFHYQG